MTLCKVDGAFHSRAINGCYFVFGLVMMQKEGQHIVAFLTAYTTRGTMFRRDCRRDFD
jgi:hypothetical protein